MQDLTITAWNNWKQNVQTVAFIDILKAEHFDLLCRASNLSVDSPGSTQIPVLLNRAKEIANTITRINKLDKS